MRYVYAYLLDTILFSGQLGILFFEVSAHTHHTHTHTHTTHTHTHTYTHTHTGSPEILHPFNRTVDVIVGIDTTAELICPYLAYPPPIVLWYATDNQGVFQQLGEDTDDRYRYIYYCMLYIYYRAGNFHG